MINFKHIKTSTDAIKATRIRLTIIITIIAWVFFALVFGAVIGTQALLMSKDTENILESALNVNSFFNDTNTPPDENAPKIPMLGTPESERCIMLCVLDDGTTILKNMQINIYSSDIQLEIIEDALDVENGEFQVDNNYFVVASKTQDNGVTDYAIKDVTSNHSQLVNMSIICVTGHFVTVLIIGILAFFLTKVALKPVGDAFEKQKELTANASHELKTPLTVISTNLAVLKSEPETTIEENEKWIESIDNQVTRMNSLIRGMLELSKLDSTKLLHVPLDLSRIVEGQCLDYEVVCFEKGIAFDSNIQPQITILGDKDTISRVILILLDNAVKYSGNKGGQITLDLTADKKVAHLSVMNTGEVISEENAKHVFDRFYRVDGARSSDVENSSFGLGLAIAKSTIEEHGGNISCHGIEGKGTIFEINLPIPNKKELQEAQNKLEEINAIQKDREKKRDEYADGKEE